MSALPAVTIYCDGACQPNPGNGGIGIVLLFGQNRKEISKHVGKQTNNSAEMLAAIEGLKALKYPCAVTIYSDSDYLVRTMTGEFSRGKNMALWHLLDAAAEQHVVEWRWVRGHNGDLNNERANVLAQQAAARTDVPLFE